MTHDIALGGSPIAVVGQNNSPAFQGHGRHEEGSCGNPVTLHFAPGSIGLSRHRRYRDLLGKSLIYSGLWL